MFCGFTGRHFSLVAVIKIHDLFITLETEIGFVLNSETVGL